MCKRAYLGPFRSPLEEIKYLFKLIFSFLRSGVERYSATQHTMPPEFGGKWKTECINTRFHLLLFCSFYFILYFSNNNVTAAKEIYPA